MLENGEENREIHFGSFWCKLVGWLDDGLSVCWIITMKMQESLYCHPPIGALVFPTRKKIGEGRKFESHDSREVIPNQGDSKDFSDKINLLSRKIGRRFSQKDR